jgi:hypothetical protein
MRSTPHLVVSISGHGFGHVAQTAPVLNALHQLMPQLRITVRSAVAVGHLRSRIHAPFTHLSSKGDIGMMMSSALDVNVDDSRAAYRKFHADWDTRVAEEARILRELKANFVLSNVGYLPLAGAQQAGIPNVALCSLNWADIYRHYCGDPSTSSGRTEVVSGRVAPSTDSGRSVDELIAAQIHACYAEADTFLRATPGMAMGNLANLILVAPIAAVGTNRRDELNRRLKLSPGEKLVLISMGGIAGHLLIECWPRIDGVRWLVQESWQVHHPDAIIIESLQTKNFCPGTRMSFGDLLASSDALICKPGYGSFVEAACSGVPVLYVNRPDWPESPALIEWLQQHNLCREVSRLALGQGNIAGELKSIWSKPQPARVAPKGVSQVADWLMSKLSQ